MEKQITNKNNYITHEDLLAWLGYPVRKEHCLRVNEIRENVREKVLYHSKDPRRSIGWVRYQLNKLAGINSKVYRGKNEHSKNNSPANAMC